MTTLKTKIITLILFILIGPLWVESQEMKWDKYIDIAIENNPGLKAQYNRYLQALEQIPQMKALPDPNLSAGIFLSPIKTRVGDQKFKLSITQMFPWFGMLNQREQQATHEAIAYYEIYLNKRDLLEYKVKSRWLDLFLIDRKIFFTHKRIEILSQLEKQKISQFKNNQEGLVNVLYLQILREELITTLKLFKDQKKTLTTSFNLLLNRERDSYIELNDSISAPFLSKITTDTLLKKHPRLRSLKARQKSINHLERATRLNGMPQIGAGIDYAIVQKLPNSNISDNGKDIIMPMVTIKLPLFGKKQKAAIKQSQLKQKELLYQYQDETNQLTNELQQSHEHVSSALRDYRLYSKLLYKAKQSLEILTSQYKTSHYGYEQAINMQQKIWIYQQKQVEAQTTFFKGIQYLKYLTGESILNKKEVNR